MGRIEDSIVRVKNGQMAGLKVVKVFPNKVVLKMFQILKNLGYIAEVKEVREQNKLFLNIFLKYDKYGDPVITEFKKISKSSRRVYSKSSEIPRIANGYATTLVSTSKGVMTGKDAREQGVGGEVLAYVL